VELDTNSQKKARFKVVLFAAILLVVTMAFAGVLNYMTFMDNYRQSQVQSFSVAGNGLVKKIEAALHYGKPLENFYGMSETLQEIKAIIPGLEEVNIVSLDGQILYSTKGIVNQQVIQQDLLKTASFAEGVIGENCSYIFLQDYCHIYLKISDSVSPHLASLEMVLPEVAFRGSAGTYLQKLALYFAVLVVIAFCCLGLFVFRTKFLTIKDRLIDKKRVLILLLLILGSSQLVYSGLNYVLFKEAYLQTAKSSIEYTQQQVTTNLKSIYRKGLTLEEISGFDEYLKETAAALPEIEKIVLVVGEQRVEASTSSVYLDKKMFDLLLDMVTVLIISIFFMIELTLLAILLLGGQSSSIKEATVEKALTHQAQQTSGLIRALIFMANIGVFMSISFVPLMMNKLYQPIAGLAPDVILGLPISAEMLAGVAAIIMAGRLIAKKGWKPIFYIGILFLTAGSFLSGTSQTALSFILYRAIAGLGLGFVMMALRSLVIMLPNQNAAIAEFSAGAVAGLNCGAVIGGMLAERIGYANVFYLSALIVLLSAFFARKMLLNNGIQRIDLAQTPGWDNFIRFISNRSVLLFLGLVFFPILVAGVFLSYSFPLFAQAHNLSQGNISRAFLLNGLCVIYLGPVLTGVTTRYIGNKGALLLSSGLIVAGMFIFMFFGNIAAALVLVILLGVSDSFGTAAQTGYFLNLQAVRQMGLSKGIGYFSIIVNIGKMMGPVIFGLAFIWGMQKGVLFLAILMTALLALFLLASKEKHLINTDSISH